MAALLTKLMSFNPHDPTLIGGAFIDQDHQDHETGERFIRVNGNLNIRGSLTQNGQPVGGGGITNSAPANTVPKSDGTNLVASRITDDGITISAGILANGQISFYLDELGNTLKVAVKYSDGTVKTGTIALL